MVIHPPMLYMGYVGFSVAFCVRDRRAARRAGSTRPGRAGRGRGRRSAWCFLTLGIALGSAWAYYELGWGGWWFWDPVENASFMPWLVRHRADPFARGHREARRLPQLDRAARHHRVRAEPARHVPRALGRAHLGARVRHRPEARHLHPRLFAAVVDRRRARAVRVAHRAHRPGRRLRAGVARDVAAREQRAARRGGRRGVPRHALSARCSTRSASGKISVGPPYFETVFVPLMAPALFLMGVGPLARWKRASAARARGAAALGARASAWPSALLLPFAFGSWTPLVGFGLRSPSGSSLTGAPQPAASGLARAARARYYGMVVAHIGVAVFVVGVTLVKGYESRAGLRMRPATASRSAATCSVSTASTTVPGPNYIAARGHGRGDARRQAGRRCCIRRSASTPCSRGDDRGGDRYRAHARSLRVAGRSARRRRAGCVQACSTSRSSTGSGAAA